MAEKKTTTKSAAEKATPRKKKETAAPAGGYHYAIGRRKRATATVKLWMGGNGEITANGKDHTEYFANGELKEAISGPLKAVGLDGKVKIDVRVSGGGPRGQAEATRMGIARAILKIDPSYRASLKPLGYLTRDPREKERKKPGLKKARRAPQWAKR
jgi:small subunit ribosomal protein S9